MKKHNERIMQALNDYLKIDRPGFGVLIKGDWGSGKSFFVKQWRNEIAAKVKKRRKDTEEDVIYLDPIYVSLNGIKSVSQIDEALKRAISPFLHGKFMKGLGKALKLAASVALRVNVDVVGDESPEQMVLTVDPRALLEFDTTKVKGERVLIFDDIERAILPVKEVLGYINYYVEHVGCHVVMIGDVTKEEDEDSFKRLKEKTIGHEYYIAAETEEALSVFVNELDKDGKSGLAGQIQLIGYCFKVSGIRNLRVLRQCLFDYIMFVSHLSKEVTDTEEFKRIKDYLLANFITVYAEYKGGNLLMEDFNRHLEAESFAEAAARNNPNKEPPKSTPAKDTQSKYERAGLMESYRVFKQGYIDCVMSYLVKGEINEEFLREEVARDRSTPWERLANYRSLSNQEFADSLNQTANYLQNGNFNSLDAVLSAACSMLVVIQKKLTYANYSAKKVKEWCERHIEEIFFPACNTLDELYGLRNHARICLSYYRGESIAKECEELNKLIEGAFARRAPQMKNSLTLVLDSLTEEKVKNLYDVYWKAVPDFSVTYSSHPIFSQVDPEKFVNSFVGLSNKSKASFIQFVKYHYHHAFCVVNAKDIVHYYEDDLTKLPEIVSRLNEAAERERLVDKENILALAETLTQSETTIRTLILERDNNTK